jgi:hypothetical protein
MQSPSGAPRRVSQAGLSGTSTYPDVGSTLVLPPRLCRNRRGGFPREDRPHFLRCARAFSGVKITATRTCEERIPEIVRSREWAVAGSNRRPPACKVEQPAPPGVLATTRQIPRFVAGSVRPRGRSQQFLHSLVSGSKLRHRLPGLFFPPTRKDTAVAERPRRLEAQEGEPPVVVCLGNLREASSKTFNADRVEAAAVCLGKRVFGELAQAEGCKLLHVDKRPVGDWEPRPADRGPDRHQPGGENQVLRLVARGC